MGTEVTAFYVRGTIFYNCSCGGPSNIKDGDAIISGCQRRKNCDWIYSRGYFLAIGQN